MSPPTLVGVDLGGTNIRAAVATGAYTHEQPSTRATPAAQGPDAVLDAIAETVAKAASGRHVDGLAVGIPGPLDPVRGVVYAAPHLHGWEGFNAADGLRRRLRCDVAIHNDANLAGYAEWVAGAGRGTRTFVFITVSTGIGGALVIDGALHGGAAGTAGEVGHTPVGVDGPSCGQGHRGCLEGTSSGTAIAAAARRALETGEASALHSLAMDHLDARAVRDAARDGDQLSRRLFIDAGLHLGRAIGGLINLLSPEMVAIGGGLINAGELLFDPLRAAVSELAFAEPARRCRIVEAALGTDAGLVGAVAWAVQEFAKLPPDPAS